MIFFDIITMASSKNKIVSTQDDTYIHVYVHVSANDTFSL